MANTFTVTEFTKFVERRTSCVTLGSGHATLFAEILNVSLELGILTEMYLRLDFKRLDHLDRWQIKNEYFKRGIKAVAEEKLEELRKEFASLSEAEG